MKIKRNLLVFFLSFSFILMMSVVILSSYLPKDSELIARKCYKKTSKGRKIVPCPPSSPAPAPSASPAPAPTTFEAYCGLVKVGVTGSIKVIKHRCAPVGKMYKKCFKRTVYAHKEKEKESYIKDGHSYGYTKGGDYTEAVEAQVCDAHPNFVIEKGFSEATKEETETKVERQCGLVPQHPKEKGHQYVKIHKCALPGEKKFSCTLQKVYRHPNVLGNYSTKKISGNYINPVNDWVCEKSEESPPPPPPPGPVSKTGPLKKKCGLVKTGAQNEGTKSEIGVYQHRCAADGKVYKSCVLLNLQAPINPEKKSFRAGGEIYLDSWESNPLKYRIKDWLCESEEVEGSEDTLDAGPMERDCGLVLYGMGKSQFRCAGKEEKRLSCQLKTVYRGVFGFTTEKSDEYKKEAKEYVCEESAEPSPSPGGGGGAGPVNKEGPLKKKCGLVQSGIEAEGTKSEFRIYKHQCAPDGKVYKSCRLNSRINAPENATRSYLPDGLVFEDNWRSFLSYRVETWVCESETVDGSEDALDAGPVLSNCGLIPNDLGKLHFRCSGKTDKKFSCQFKTVYKGMFGYTTEKSSTYKKEAKEYVCEDK